MRRTLAAILAMGVQLPTACTPAGPFDRALQRLVQPHLFGYAGWEARAASLREFLETAARLTDRDTLRQCLAEAGD